MSLPGEVLRGLGGMFVADARLTGALLAVVAGVAALIHPGGVAPWIGGVLLLAGCLGVLALSLLRSARRLARQKRDTRRAPS